MICEIISQKGEKGSGGGRDAFSPGIEYVCGKALRIELLNLTCLDWNDAAGEMLLTSELSAGVQKPYYHVVLSWHEHEQPTPDQQFEAMRHLIKTLGLEEHQVAIGNHADTKRAHIHAIVNTVHPITGKVWSKSNDFLKAERACREIELRQGWAHDRGRFDFEVAATGDKKTVRLQPAQAAWAQKQRKRAAGKRKPSPGDIAIQKHHGFESFSRNIPPALKDRFAQAVAKATDWNSLHEALAPLGLRYRKQGSGARVSLVGSEEFAKASAFGQGFSLARLQKRLGPYEEAETDLTNPLKPDHIETGSVTGRVSTEAAVALKATAFKMTLLRRMYTNLHLDAQVAQQIRYVDLDGKPPQVTFQDNSSIVDHGEKISTSAVTQTTIKATVAMAKAKGWQILVPSGSPDYIRGIAIEAAKSGLRITDVPAEIQALADALLEQGLKKASRLTQDADTALKEHLDSAAAREDAVADNMTDAARQAAEDIPGDAPSPPEPRAPRRPAVPNPQPAPDAAKIDRRGPLRIQRQLREIEWAELEDMKRLDIGIIAAQCNWSDITKTHPDNRARDGKDDRVFQRADETIKASLIDGKWLWTSTRSGQSGSVIDLWRESNPDKTIGHARAALRKLLAASPLPSPTQERRGAPEGADHTEARQRWEEAPYITRQRPYAPDRGVAAQTLARFPDQVRVCVFGDLYFAHRNFETGDIQGFEQHREKNDGENTAHFAKGGRKTINVLGNRETANRMAVVERGLDALALAELEGRDDTLYVSTGGGFGALTENALQQLAMGRDEVLSSFNNGGVGEAMHAELLKLVPDAAHNAPSSLLEGSDRVCESWMDVLNEVRDGIRADLLKDTLSEKAAPSEDAHPPVEPSSEQPSADDEGPGFG